MKSKITILILFFTSSILFAQEETLVSGGLKSSGFGGPVIKFTQLDGKFGVLVGGRGGWIINSTFIIGGGGYGLVNNISSEDCFCDYSPKLTFGYGGLELEYIIMSDNLIHFSIYTLFGAGAVSYRDDKGWEDWHNDFYKENTFFVAEPAVNVEVNITTFFRMSFGGGYRFISGVNKAELSNSDLSGFAGVLAFKFGSF